MKVLTKSPPSEPVVERIPLTRLQRIYRRLFVRSLQTLQYGQILLDEPYLKEVSSLGSATGGGPVVSLEIRSPEFYKDVVLRGSLGAGEAWTAGIWDTSDLEGLIRIMLRNRDVLDGLEQGPARLAAWVLRWLDNRNANSKTGSRRNIAAHYDLGNEFFAAFLDSTMTYSCAVFEAAEASLEEAQRAKLDRLCRKLELGPEDQVLEIGTGWGSFAIHAAGNYGCRVTTTTISQRQFEEARRRVQVAGLEDRVDVVLQDYRDLNGQFDKLVSIEMIEAVGDNFLDTWFAACSGLLKPEGRMGIQAITIADQHYASALREVDFIKRYIFPGSFIPSVTRMMNAMTDSTDLRLVHLEDFGPHYAETLRRWRAKLNAVEGELLEQGHTPEFLRMWNYYLGYCAGGFEERFLGVSQLVFRKPLAETQPLLGPLA
jgi:cyclopropane-fatty-acyl-phospholipid synthase